MLLLHILVICTLSQSRFSFYLPRTSTPIQTASTSPMTNPMNMQMSSRVQMQTQMAKGLALQRPSQPQPALVPFKAELKYLIERYAEVLKSTNKSSNPTRLNRDSNGRVTCVVMENPCKCPLDNFCCVSASYDKLFTKLDNVWKWLIGLDYHQKKNVSIAAVEGYLLSCPDWLAEFFRQKFDKTW